jgi:hypothetical protein
VCLLLLTVSWERRLAVAGGARWLVWSGFRGDLSTVTVSRGDSEGWSLGSGATVSPTVTMLWIQQPFLVTGLLKSLLRSRIIYD